jgi:hypothetical protein
LVRSTSTQDGGRVPPSTVAVLASTRPGRAAASNSGKTRGLRRAADLHRGTRILRSLTDELRNATADLEQLKRSIGTLTQAGQIAQKAINTLTSLVPFL